MATWELFHHDERVAHSESDDDTFLELCNWLSGQSPSELSGAGTSWQLSFDLGAKLLLDRPSDFEPDWDLFWIKLQNQYHGVRADGEIYSSTT